MSYRFIYSQPECNRIIPAVLIDKRSAIPEIRNKAGAAIKLFTDAQVALVTSSCVFYKIETDTGNLGGYFTIQVIREGVGVLLQYELRPAFQQFDLQISQEIGNFITNGGWKEDYL